MVLQFQCAIDTEKREDTSIITNLHDNGQTVIPTHVVPTFFCPFCDNTYSKTPKRESFTLPNLVL